MEWNPETLQFLSQCFLLTLSPQLETRRAAESSLSEAADTPNYGLCVLRLVVEPSVNEKIRQAAAINFKNYIRTRWVPSNDPNAVPAFSSIRKQEKEQIKTLLVSLMLSASPRIQSELSEALAPPSLAKHIKASVVKWLWGKLKLGLDFRAKYELGKELGRGMFGYTFSARAKTGELKDQLVAERAEDWTEGAMREIKILRALSGHKHFIKFYDTCEDHNNVYIIMELCEGGDLSNRIRARGGRYTEEDAKALVTQILSAVSFCHLQGIAHRDLKPKNLLLTSAGEDAELKLIDFGLSDFIRPGERFQDFVGTICCMAPEVIHGSYSLEVDSWSIGVITYLLLSGRWPFWGRTRSEKLQSVQESDLKFDDLPWSSISPEAKDFIKRLLNKNTEERMTAAEALSHRWLRDESRPIPLDILMYMLVSLYLLQKPLRRAAQKALSKALTEDEALSRNATDIMDESWVPETLSVMGSLANGNMYFEEFCAAAIHICHLEGVEGGEQIVLAAFEHFEQEGNQVISEEELCQEMNMSGPKALSYVQDCIRKSDGKLNFIGFTKLLGKREY
ncbi:hypothetical protein COLO4_28677 [Corchorus olitorius]|uniref:non-specific serine/threonine protein kinase n=1 Tax=Corchorus olitorius TaxID=93759 RepID=A0A1R3HIU0_9ROSI|nr:hypothetical protein COLO4_28677 [Corchorus olitorius]